MKETLQILGNRSNFVKAKNKIIYVHQCKNFVIAMLGRYLRVLNRTFPGRKKREKFFTIIVLFDVVFSL